MFMFMHQGMCDHVAVSVENHIIVFGGTDGNDEYALLRTIWMYNVYTQQWGKHVIPRGEMAPPGTQKPCAVVIEGDIYMFGGWDYEERDPTNAVWRLTRTPERCFEWRKSMAKGEENTPSPRHSHSGWEYEGQLWTFGGYGLPLAGYLHDHGDFNEDVEIEDFGENNQLLCYDPLSEDWRNLNPSGTIPEPRLGHGSTVIGDNVWMYGGHSTNPYGIHHELYQLNMANLTWTEIQDGQLKPPLRTFCSMTAVTKNQIVLHGGESASYESLNDTWILDLPSLSWKAYKAGTSMLQSRHTGNACLSSGVIMIGGKRCKESYSAWNTMVFSADFFVRLEPKTLQQLAIQKIYRECHPRRRPFCVRRHHGKRVVFPFEVLPDSLKTLFQFPANAVKQQTRKPIPPPPGCK